METYFLRAGRRTARFGAGLRFGTGARFAAGLRLGAGFFFGAGLRFAADFDFTDFGLAATWHFAFAFALRLVFVVAGRSSRLAAAARRVARTFSSSAIAEPSSAGLRTVRSPASSSARNLSAAVPLPPDTTAPA